MINKIKRLVLITVLLLTMAVIIITVYATPTADHFSYLPTIKTPPFVVADFESDGCQKTTNNLGGEMGSAFDPTSSDVLIETYILEDGRGCIVQLNYEIPDYWSAFWLKLLHADLTPFTTLSFDVKYEGEIDLNTDMEIKLEIKRDCQNQMCNEVWIQYVPGITESWQLKTVNLADFYSPSKDTLPPFNEIEELVFTFEHDHISSEGLISLDNVIFEP